MAFQKTLKNAIRVSGTGLHSGCVVNMVLKPAEAGFGLRFKRTDLEPAVEIPVTVDKVHETVMCTKLEEAGVSVATVEHLLSALAAMRIDNILIELDGPEVPVMDGSAAPFIFAIQSAGIEKQEVARRFIRIKKAVRVEQDDKYVELLPYSGGFTLHLTMDFPHPAIQSTCQEIEFDFSPMGYVKEVSRARTFGAAADLEALHKNNLALGANLTNAVGLGDKDVLNPEGLRYPDEFVKHKLLDAIGDLYVAGPIKGAFRGHKSSHQLNNLVLKKLLADDEAWEWME